MWNQRSGRSQKRRGSTLIVVCILLGIMMVAVAFSVDFARIQLTQLELQSVADLSSRAGAEAMARGVGDPDDMLLTDAAVRDEILMVGRLNTVSGSAAQLDADDIQFGQAHSQSNNQITFSASPSGTATVNTDSVRVSPGVENYPITFGKFVGRDEIDLGTQAAAMVAERDIVVVLDRSTSMTSRDAGTIDLADYPPHMLAMEQALWDTEDAYHPESSDFHGREPRNGNPARDVLVEVSGTTANLTRLQALRISVHHFIKEIEDSKSHERLGLTTYASVANAPSQGQSVIGGHDYDIENGLLVPELTQIVGTGITDEDWPNRQAPTQKYASALENEGSGYAGFKLNYLAMRWCEQTHMVDGMDKGVNILFGAGHRPMAVPVLIFMTDGRHNQSGDPVLSARAHMAAHPEMLIYTISFGAGADQDIMGDVAYEGNGVHHHANSVGELIDVFRELGQNAGVTLIE